MSPENYVIYDCDLGSDDAWGLFMLIRGEELFQNKNCNPPPTKKLHLEQKLIENYKILAITCVQGNTDVDNVAQNALRILDAADRIDIPIYRGCAEPIIPRRWQRKRYFHGLDGFADLEYEKPVDLSLIKEEHAVSAMYRLVCDHPNQIDFILVGPLTNFANCINLYGKEFLDKVRKIYIMGGNYRGKGNITKSAEFNFMMDPEAAYIVLEKVKEKQMVVLPWETCIDGNFGLTLDWRLNVLGEVSKNPVVKLLNRIESAVLKPKLFINWIVCDATLIAAYLFPHLAIVKQRDYHATVELYGNHTRGQMVLDHLRINNANVSIITEISGEYLREIFRWAADDPDVNLNKLF